MSKVVTQANDRETIRAEETQAQSHALQVLYEAEGGKSLPYAARVLLHREAGLKDPEPLYSDSEQAHAIDVLLETHNGQDLSHEARAALRRVAGFSEPQR